MRGRFTGKLRLRQHDECSGHCCKAFTLKPPTELYPLLARLSVEGQPQSQEEARYIAAMLIPIGPAADHPELIAADGGGKDEHYYYTCKHFDGRQCTDYANRPNICSNYPYNQKCSYVDCTARDRGRAPSHCTIGLPIGPGQPYEGDHDAYLKQALCGPEDDC